jgi:hypothetical protein
MKRNDRIIKKRERTKEEDKKYEQMYDTGKF